MNKLMILTLGEWGMHKKIICMHEKSVEILSLFVLAVRTDSRILTTASEKKIMIQHLKKKENGKYVH